MSAALLRFILRRHRVATLLSLLPPAIIGVACGLMYPTIVAKENEPAMKLARSFTKVLDTQALDFLSPAGFFCTPFNHPLTLIMIALAVGVPALTLPAAERGRGALDLLLATPLTRRRLMRSVGLAVAISACVLPWSPLLGVALGAPLAGVNDAVPYARMAVASLHGVALALSLAGFVMLCSAVAADFAQATTRYVSVLAASLVLDVVGRIWEGGKWLRWCTPIGWYRPMEVVSNHVTAGNPPFWARIVVLLSSAAAFYIAAEVVAVRRRRA